MDVSAGGIFQPQVNTDGSGLTPPAIAAVTTAGTAVSGSLQGNNGSPNLGIFNQSSFDAMVNVGPNTLAAASASVGFMIPARAMIVINAPAGATTYSAWMNGTGNVLMWRGTGG